MNIVMFHSGKSLPVFLGDCLKQLRLFNPDIPVYFLINREHLTNPVFNLYNITTVDMSKYVSNDVYTFDALYGRGRDDFWTITTTRLMYVENFIFSNSMQDVYHFENDVLLYADIKKMHPVFVKLYKDLAITVGGPDKCMTGFMFIKRALPLRRMTYFFVQLLKSNSIHKIRKQYKVDMVNEMTLMRIYSKEYPELMKFLPILPFGDYSENYDEFNSVFDPASYGQYVGGTMNGVPGAKPQDHYIGRLLEQHPDYTVVWKQEKQGRVPYFKYDGQEVKINNLHIHSKNLNLYVS